MGRVKELEKMWEDARDKRKLFETKSISHVVTLKKFLEELDCLFELTCEQKYRCFKDQIINSQLVDKDGNWARRRMPFDSVPRPDPSYRVEMLIRKGLSIREACAEVAAVEYVEAVSFAAASRKVERAWRNSRYAKARHSVEGKSP